MESVNNNKQKSPNIKGFSWDFSAPYDNLSPTLVIKALRCAISELRSNEWEKEFVDWLIQLVELSLKSAFAKYGNNWFRSLIPVFPLVDPYLLR